MFNKFSNELFETLWNNNKVKQTPCAKHLGIWLDSELNFKKHVDFILKKMPNLCPFCINQETI